MTPISVQVMMILAAPPQPRRFISDSWQELMPHISRRKFVALTAMSTAAGPLTLRASALGAAVTAQVRRWLAELEDPALVRAAVDRLVAWLMQREPKEG